MYATEHRRRAATLCHFVSAAVRIQAHLVLRSHEGGGRCPPGRGRHSQGGHCRTCAPGIPAEPLLDRREHVPLEDEDQEYEQSLHHVEGVRYPPQLGRLAEDGGQQFQYPRDAHHGEELQIHQEPRLVGKEPLLMRVFAVVIRLHPVDLALHPVAMDRREHEEDDVHREDQTHRQQEEETVREAILTWGREGGHCI